MHDSSLDSLRVFVSAYLGAYADEPLSVLDVGSAVVEPGQPSDKDVITSPHWRYIGMDIMPGHNVDVVVKDPYKWEEIASSSVDVVICNQVMEHAEYFWLTMQEIARVLKPRGLAAIITPSAGPVHRYPVDCWRFYPDGLPAVARYAGLDTVETHRQLFPLFKNGSRWQDAAIIVQKPAGACASAIATAKPLGALHAREQALLAAMPNWKLRWRAIRPHLRAISRLIRYPIHRLPEANNA